MQIRSRRLLMLPAAVAIVAVAFFVIAGRQSRVDACGAFFSSPVFVTIYVPDPPHDTFFAGRLGHVRPTWARLYLTAAYRYLSAKPLNEAEQQALRALLDLRDRDLGPPGRDSLSRWMAARRLVPAAGPDPTIDLFRPLASDRYPEFQNCNGDAFEAAAATLNGRVKTLGATSPELTAWLRAQDDVFSNCSGGRTIPEAVPPSAPLLARQDRSYQIAAALFYATDYDAAGTAFRSIAEDRGSPWRTLAPYLAARCLIRKATVGAPEGSFDRPLLEQAGRELRALAQAANNAHDRAMAEQLLGFVDARVTPIDRIRQLGTAIQSGAGSASGSIKRSLLDYKLLLDRANGEGNFEPPEEMLRPAQSDFDGLAAVRQTSDLTDWVITFQAAGPAARDHALARWRESRSPAWLVALLEKTKGDSPDVQQIVEAARSIDANSPASPTVLCDVIRLQLERGQHAAARESIDRVLAGKPDWPESPLNELRAWRMALARNLDEFLRFAPRVPAASTVGDDWDVSEAPRGNPRWQYEFDVDGAAVFNRALPLSMLERVAASASLPETLRGEVGLATWTRAVLLGQDAVARQAFGFVERAAPSLKTDLAAYRNATGATARGQAALFLLLELPGARPFVARGLGRDPYATASTPAEEPATKLDQFRDNWWCDGGDFSGMSSYKEYRDPAKPLPGAPSPPFLDEAARREARREDEQMRKLPTAPVLLCDRTVAWAKAAPKDPRVPEALYLAIRTSRYGCWTQATTASSRAAFQLLKTRYANTEWAKKTKYYY